MEKETYENAVLSISHTSYLNNVGGLEKFILDQYSICNSNGYTFLALYPIRKRHTIKGHVVSGPFIEWGFHINGSKAKKISTEELIKELSNYNIKQIYIHSLIYSPFDAIKSILLHNNTAEVLFYIHDYKSICSCHILMKNNKVYCGEDGIKLSKCVSCRHSITGLFTYREYKKFIKEYPNIKFIFPSEPAKRIWSRVYSNIPESNKYVIPHQIFGSNVMEFKHQNGNKIRIAYVGYKAFNKGWDTFKELVSKCQVKHLPYEFYILGNTDENLPNVNFQKVSFQTEGTDAMVNAIRRNNIDIVILWSPWPETYSYTFFESYIGGANVITCKDSGNIAYQVKKLQCGKVYENKEELFEDINNFVDLVQKHTERPQNLILNEKFLTILR